MSDIELTCPFCNARVPPPGPVPPGTRLSCPRCDETFPYEGAAGGAIQAPAGLTALPPPEQRVQPAPAAPAPVLRGKPIRANRLVGGIVLGVMLLMAATGLTYALLTEQVRRDHDKALPRTSRRPALPPLRHLPEPDPVAPGRLAALGYLPSNTGLVVGLHVQDLLSSPAGKELRNRPVKLGKWELRLDALRDLTGLDVEDIDHAVLGMVLARGEGPDLPPTYLVVRTRRPFNAPQLRAALKAREGREVETPDGGKRVVYSAAVRGLPMTLWLPGDRTVVLGLLGDLAGVPSRPNEGLDHLSAVLRKLIEARISTGMAAWAAGHADDWKATLLPVLLANFKDTPVLGRIEQVRGFALGVLPEKPLKLQGAFRCADEATARKIEEQDLAPRAKKEPGRFKYGRDGAWLDVQWKLDASP
jgi:hypothetical protein